MTYQKHILCSLLILFLCFNNLHAQLLVHQEPLHPPVFQNKQIRILNAQLPAGDSTQFHIHHTPSVFIFLTSTTITSALQNGNRATSTSKAGSIIFENLSAPNQRIHKVLNNDKNKLHVLDVELLYKDTGFTQKPLSKALIQLETDTAWIRTYRLELELTDEFSLKEENRSFLLVSLNDARVKLGKDGKQEDRTLKAGSFFEIKKNQPFYLKSLGDKVVQFALLELPK